MICMRDRLAIFFSEERHVDIVILFQIHMMPWHRVLTELDNRGGETAITSTRRAALAIRANKSLLPEQTSAEQLWQ